MDISLSKRLVDALEAYRAAWTEEHGYAPADGDLLFPSATDATKPMSRQSADKALRKATAALGLEGVSTHTFRRSFATTAVSKGVSLPAVQRVTGHKSLSGLTPYIEVDQADVMAALELA